MIFVYLVVFVLLNVTFQSKLKIASLQLSRVGLSPKERYTKSVTEIQKASANSADVVITPADWNEFSEHLISDYSDVAKINSISICFTYTRTFKNQEVSYINIVDRFGKLVLEYAKNHETNSSVPVSNHGFNQTDLDTKFGHVGVGVLFFSDLFFPESTRVLMLEGSEIVFVSADDYVSDFDVRQLKVRAHENVNSVMMANSAKGTSFSDSDVANGKSMFCDWLINCVFANESETILYAEHDVEALRDWRGTGAIHGDSYRRPYCYRSLCYNDFLPEVLSEESVFTDDSDLVVRIGLLQMNPTDSVHDNLVVAEKYLKMAADKGVDIAIMPEMFSVGYSRLVPTPITDYGIFKWERDFAMKLDDPFIEHFRNLAKELDIAIGVTFLRENIHDPPGNSIMLIDRHGEIVYTYDKVHTCTFLLEINNTPGRKFFVSKLNTKAGDINVGSMICFDRSNTEPARLIMQQGAELIIATNGCDMSEMNIMQLGIRAHENAIGLCLTNYPAPTFNGNSVIYDHLGNQVVVATDEEGVFIGEINISNIRRYRATEMGKAMTNLKLYPELCKLQRSKLFTRPNVYDRVAGNTT